MDKNPAVDLVYKVYFGEQWDAAKFDPGFGVEWHQIPTPTDKCCLYCEEQIVDGDRGELTPYVGRDRAVQLQPIHTECMIASVSGCYFGVCFNPAHGGFTGSQREYALAVLHKLNERRAAQGMGPL